MSQRGDHSDTTSSDESDYLAFHSPAPALENQSEEDLHWDSHEEQPSFLEADTPPRQRQLSRPYVLGEGAGSVWPPRNLSSEEQFHYFENSSFPPLPPTHLSTGGDSVFETSDTTVVEEDNTTVAEEMAPTADDILAQAQSTFDRTYRNWTQNYNIHKKDENIHTDL